VEFDDWRRTIDGSYEVYLLGQWRRIEPWKITINQVNPTGKAIVWFDAELEVDDEAVVRVIIYCFKPLDTYWTRLDQSIGLTSFIVLAGTHLLFPAWPLRSVRAAALNDRHGRRAGRLNLAGDASRSGAPSIHSNADVRPHSVITTWMSRADDDRTFWLEQPNRAFRQVNQHLRR
jgi:hypothetical protein